MFTQAPGPGENNHLDLRALASKTTNWKEHHSSGVVLNQLAFLTLPPTNSSIKLLLHLTLF